MQALYKFEGTINFFRFNQQLPYYKPAEARGLQYVYRAVMPYDIVSEIRRRAQSNRLMMRFGLEAGERLIVDSRSKIQDVVSQIQILQGIDKGTLQLFLPIARLDMRFEGDRISEEEMARNFIIVTDGMVNHNIDAGDGWFNTLDMVTAGLPLNEAVLIENRRCKLAAEVVSETATLLIVPLEEMNKILKRAPQLWQNIARHALSEMENYQSIWCSRNQFMRAPSTLPPTMTAPN